MSDPAQAHVEVTASSSKFERVLQKARETAAKWGSAVARGVGSAFKGLNKATGFSDSTKAGVGFLKGEMMSRGLDAITDGASRVQDFERTLMRFGIATNKSGDALDGMRTQIRNVSRDTGIGDSDILAAVQTYVDLTGNVDGATSAMSTFARVSKASGSSMSDVAQASAALADAGVGMDQMEAVFSGFITQGKMGAVGLKDFAGELASLAPRWAKFKDSMDPEGIAEFGAAFQVIRKGFGNAQEAGTGFQALMGAFSLNAKKFQDAGVKLFDVGPDKVKRMKSFEDIMSQIEKSKLVKDPTLMTKALGSKEAEQSMAMLLKSRTIETGKAASAYADLVKAGGDAEAVARDYATAQESASGRIDKAMNAMKVTIAEAFTPERITAFANALEGIAGKLGPVVDFVGKIADKMGAIFDLGHQMAGGDDRANPYNDSLAAKLYKDYDPITAKKAMEDPDYLRKLEPGTWVMDEQAKRVAFNKQRDAIMKAEGGAGRMTPEAVEAARMAVFAGGDDAASDATRLAGSMYLDANGVKGADTQKWRRDRQDTGSALIVEAIRTGFANVKMEPNFAKDKVVDAVRTGKANNTRP